MKNALAKILPGVFLSTLLASMLTLDTGCVVRPVGYGYHHPHYHHPGRHRGWY